MANKPTTTDVAANAQYLASVINSNFSILEDAIEDCLGRGGTSESPNSMEGDLDMDLNKIINVGPPSNDNDAIRLIDLSDSDATGSASAQLRSDLGSTNDGFGAELIGNNIVLRDTVSDLTSSTIDAGKYVRTGGYYSKGDDGRAFYLVKTSAEYGGTPDEKGDHTLANSNIAVLQIESFVNVKQFGAKGDGATDDTASFTSAASKARIIKVPYTSSSYLVDNTVVNTASTFIFEGDDTQLSGTATEAQLNAIFIKERTIEGDFLGVPYSDLLRSSKIGIVAGTIEQNSSTRTQWDYISDSAHVPVGVSGAYATASGGQITIDFDKTYSRVISFIAGPDETLANVMGFTVGASVGLSSAVLSADANFNGAFTVYYNGSTWVFSSGTGQEINPTFSSYSNGTLTITHDYCRGIAANVNPFSNGGAVVNPYMPIVKTIGNSSIEIQWIDTTTGNIVTGAASTRMMASVTKDNNAGLFLDGTNDADVINNVDISTGNIWFFGIFEE